eukprot:m.735241 g.735241  ORF g.735241 m.735241 type:complete len:313 (+) comp58890_c0_seq2:1002-1940(+)
MREGGAKVLPEGGQVARVEVLPKKLRNGLLVAGLGADSAADIVVRTQNGGGDANVGRDCGGSPSGSGLVVGGQAHAHGLHRLGEAVHVAHKVEVLGNLLRHGVHVLGAVHSRGLKGVGVEGDVQKPVGNGDRHGAGDKGSAGGLHAGGDGVAGEPGIEGSGAGRCWLHQCVNCGQRQVSAIFRIAGRGHAPEQLLELVKILVLEGKDQRDVRVPGSLSHPLSRRHARLQRLQRHTSGAGAGSQRNNSSGKKHLSPPWMHLSALLKTFPPLLHLSAGVNTLDITRPAARSFLSHSSSHQHQHQDQEQRRHGRR